MLGFSALSESPFNDGGVAVLSTTFNFNFGKGSPGTPDFSFATVVQGDPYFEKVSLLLSMNGPEGVSVLQDSSPRKKVPDALGTSNAKLTAVKSKFGGTSLRLPGVTQNDYCQFLANPDFVLAGSQFTVEFWIYIVAYNAVGGRLAAAGGGAVAWNSTNGIHWLLQTHASGCGFYMWDGATSSIRLSPNIPLNTWSHVAFTYDGTTFRAFLDGALFGSTAVASFSKPSTLPFVHIGTIAGEGGVPATQAANCYLDDFRITKGIARYVDVFSPPIAQYPDFAGVISGTIKDSSGNLVDRKVRVYSRNTGELVGIDYSGLNGDKYFNKTTLLLHGDEFIDTSIKSQPVKFGTVSLSPTQTKFKATSFYFTGDKNCYITIPYNTNVDLSDTDFTVEMFVYKTANNTGSFSRLWNPDGDVYSGLNIAIDASGNLAVHSSRYGSSWDIVSSPTVAALSNNTWYHIAVVRLGGSMFAYVNGVRTVLTTTMGGSALYTPKLPIIIGGQNSPSRAFFGYITEIRVSKFARYSLAFTPPVDSFPDNPCSLNTTGSYSISLPTLEENYVTFMSTDAETTINSLIFDRVTAK